MPIDASIYSQVGQGVQPFNPLAEMAQVQQLQGLQQQNQLAQLAFGDRQRARADQERLRGIYAGGKQGSDLEGALLTGGFANEALKFGKDRRENQKIDAETANKSQETGSKAFDLYRMQLGTVQDPQQAASLVSAAYNDPTIGPLMQRYGTLESGLQRLQEALAQPGGFAQWKANAAIGIEKLASLAQTQNVNLGGNMVTQSVQPATGQVTQLGSAPITVDANTVANNATSRANNTATVGASYANAAATRDVAQSNRDAANIQTGFKNETELRKEFEGLPEVKNYKQAYPAYAAVKDAASRNTPQADINLVYGIAKLYDPTSVVREGEYATVANSPNIPERIKGYAQYLAGGGKLSPETKKQILAEAEGRIGTYRGEVEKAKGSYGNIAKTRGIPATSVFQAMGDSPAGSAAPSSAVDDALKKYP